MDSAMRDSLLQDPQVQAAMKKAGTDALNNPEVQQALLNTAKEKFPQYAGQAKDQVVAWANDPAVQAQAKQYASAAMGYAAGAGDQFMRQIEQGPAGVRFISFCGSLASMTLSVMSLINIFSVFGHLVLYMISVYQFLFAFTTALFEMPPEWVAKVQSTVGLPVDNYQNLLMENAKFMSLVGGRGAFYIFQGTLWLSFASVTEVAMLGIGLYLVFIGALHILMHFNIAPKDIATKMRSGYSSVVGQPGSSGQP
eukprot:TRINITY_DN19435_c0_g1_i1.p1 TRINITY_DN19435_c0_g1~~TRINITY_DN19435_c0_g1_i1.p1  ORF type:complete len:253 (-),score=75.16 TRINITY_DN19435_c0_g1_i1:116-874(-)